MRLTLVRHGETEWNALHRYLGQSDLPLNPTGESQATALGQRLTGRHFDAIYVSPLRRTRQTAEKINHLQNFTLEIEPRLREISFGDWEGLTYAEVQARDPEHLTRWQADAALAPPNGESLNAITERIREFVEHLRAKHLQDQAVLLVTHKGVIRVMLCLLLGMPPIKYWQFDLDPAALSEIAVYENTAILTKFNDTSHLGG